MQNEPLLTIAIPTYNRSGTLEKILQQLSKEERGLFRILVSDDQSSDDTGAMVARYQSEMPHLAYHRNEKNLGYSGNVCKLYELADTRYVWFFCDDDSILPGAVKKIADALKAYEPAVAVFNHSWVDPYGRTRVAVPSEYRKLHDDLYALEDYQPLMRITFLSTLVVERRPSVAEVIKRTDYQDNVFFQLTLALLILSENPRFCEIGDIILHRNVGFKYGEFFKFYFIDVLKAAYAVDHKFDNAKFVKRMVEEIPVGFQLYLSQKLGLFSYSQSPTPDTLEKIALYYGRYRYFILAFRPIKMLIPAAFLKAVYIVQLISIHGPSGALATYRQNINRAFTDGRKTEFMNYK